MTLNFSNVELLFNHCNDACLKQNIYGKFKQNLNHSCDHDS